MTRESAGNPFKRISGARAFSHVQRLSLDPAEPCSADSPLAGEHQSYNNSCMLSYVPYERVPVRGGVAFLEQGCR